MKKKIFKIAVLFSSGASAARYLMKNDPNYGITYEFVFALSNKKDASGIDFFSEQGVYCEMLNTKVFCLDNGYTGKIKDMPSMIREGYFEEVVKSMSSFDIDLIILSGFMLGITKPLLGLVPIINVHPADLSILDNNKPKYTGDDAVTMAIEAGEKYTASTIHVVEAEVDQGRIIYISEPLEVSLDIKPKDHQNMMKTLCDGPAYKKAIEMIVTGDFVI